MTQISIIDDIYLEGYTAYVAGLDIHDNPYNSGDELSSWDDGWYQARQDILDEM